MTPKTMLFRQTIAYKHKLLILAAIISPCLSRLLLQGSGAEDELFRYLAPAFLGGMTGYWAGHLLDRYHNTLHRSWKSNNRLKKKIQDQRMLRGIIPICAHCRQIRDRNGDWTGIEEYIQHHSGAKFSHGLCPDCAQQHYPMLYELENI